MRKNALPVLLLLGVLLPLPARAELGGDIRTVENDRIQMKAALQTRQAGAFAIHEIKTPTGSTVREYISPQGKVFGVSWQGPTMPDLKQLLGSYYAQASQALKEQRAKRVIRGPINIQQPGFVFQQSGHMRSYFGRAYVPGMMPQGVGPEAVQ